ncbi:putative F-box/LRR protein, partial [Hyalella azteca]
MAGHKMAPTAGISNLPDELLVEILSYLTPQEIYRTVVHVCERWRNIASDPSLWTNLTVHPEDLVARQDVEGHVECCKNDIALIEVAKMTSLRLDALTLRVSNRIIVNRLISDFKPAFPRLKHLDLKEIAIDKTAFEKESKLPCLRSLSVAGASLYHFYNLVDFRNIRHLRVDHLHNYRERLPDSEYTPNLLYLSQTCIHLEELELYGAPLPDDVLESFLTNSRGRLKTLGLTIPCGKPFWVQAIEYNMSTSLVKLIIDQEPNFLEYFFGDIDLLGMRNLSSLKYLEFSVSVRGYYDNWNQARLREFFHSSTFIHLETLNVANVRARGDVVLKSICTEFKFLKHLKISKWSGVSDAGIRAMLSDCNYLETLELRKLDTDFEVETFAALPRTL